MAAPDGPHVRRFDVLDGTNAEALRTVEAGGQDCWIVADRQSAGRGRRGRRWISGEGDLLVTRLLTLDAARAAHAPELSFVAAVAVVDALSDVVDPARLTLKWPNDVMLDGVKCAGILLEGAGAGSSGPMRIAVGIGVNLSAKSLPDRAVAYFSITRDELFAKVRAAFETRFAAWARQGFDIIASAWRARAFGLGARVRVTVDGRTVEGVALDIDGTGALTIRMDDGTSRRITAGDVDVF